MADHTGDFQRWEDVLEGRLILRRGDSGFLVRMAQERLNAVGYDLEATEHFCTQTEFSVMDFQKNHQIERTGEIGSATASALDQRWADTWEQVKGGYKTVALGSQCSAVATLQKKLGGLGYGLEVSGVFGPSTKRRLIAFQERMKLPETGTLDAVTAQAIEEAEENRPAPRRGRPLVPSDLEQIGNAWVAPQVREGLQRMIRAARGDGVAVQAIEGYRDETRQHQAFREGGFVTTSACTGNPGENAHGTGFAVDLDDGRNYRWLRRNAAVFGFSMPHVGEPWHWVYTRK